MSLPTLLVAIICFPAVLLAVHIVRDVRGEARNKKGLCYSCGRVHSPAVVVSHHRGGVYVYCSGCGKNHSAMKGIAVSAAALAGAIACAAIALAKWESEPLKAVVFGGIAASVFIVAVAAAVGYANRRK